jgi:hypothetical protein
MNAPTCRCTASLVLAILFSICSAFAGGMPDTGQTTCFTASAADNVPASDPASVARDAGTYPRQDCRYGRDPAVVAGNLIKKGAGAAGLDYTKIANNGTTIPTGAALGTSATDWACTRDNVTGLTWEVKTATNTDLRYSGHTYAWFNADSATNGGNAGDAGSNTCNGTLTGGQCNTTAYLAALNAAALCGHSDWRLPSPREVLTLFFPDTIPSAVDPTYFPNSGGQVWTTLTNAGDSTQAWQVSYTASLGFKNGTDYVRAVRGGPF